MTVVLRSMLRAHSMGLHFMVEITSAGEFFATDYLVEDAPGGNVRIVFVSERKAVTLEVVSVVLPEDKASGCILAKSAMARLPA